MHKLQIAICDDCVAISVTAGKDDEAYSVRMSPQAAREVGFRLVEMADEIDPPFQEGKA